MSGLSEGAAELLIRRALPLMEEYARAAGSSLLLDFGPVPLPRRDFPVLSFPVAQENTLPPREKLCAVSCFCTGLLSSAACSAMLHDMRIHAPCALLLDFKEPERNLEYPASLVSAPLRVALGSRRHHGGMEALLYEEGLRPLARRTLLAGVLCLVVLHFDARPGTSGSLPS